MLKLLGSKSSGAFLALCIILTGCGGSGSSGGVELPAGGPSAAAAQPLSYHGHAKALIDSRCVTCHHVGGQGPFSLSEYSDVASKRSAMIYALESGSMPSPGFAPLTGPERQLLLQWLEEGALEGTPRRSINTTPYTYYGHAKAIIEEKCANCHKPGEIAPFSLTDYQSVYKVRAAMAHQIASKAMPPWPPTNHYLTLEDNRSLTDNEQAVLESWISGGAPVGHPNDYVSTGKPPVQIDYNLLLQMNEPYTPTQLPDDYRCLMIDWPLDHTVFVDAVNVLPDIKAQVHHVFAVIIDPANLAAFEAADGADGKPGFPCWGAPSPAGALVPPRTLTVWAPGITGGYLPRGTGVRVEPGSKIVMQMHYNTVNVEPTPDQSGLEIRYVDAVEREALTLFFLNFSWPSPGGMPIPAGDPSVTVQHTSDVDGSMRFVRSERVGITTDKPFALHSVYMHQHVLGKFNSLELIRENGTEVKLIDIRNWDFDWQDEYTFENEIIVQPGDQFRLTCNWDNSAANQQFVNGEQLAPRHVEFGEGTFDEMCVSYFYVTRVADEDEGKLQDIPPTVAFYQPQHLQEFEPGDYVPVELLVNAFKLQEPHDDHDAHEYRAGHYHLTLDGVEGAETLVNWEEATFYRLPENIQPGKHTLRVSLRDDLHQPLGVEDSVNFVVKPAQSEDQGARTESLIDASDWVYQEAATDSLAEHRPDAINCPKNAWYEEDDALEVQTGYCNYLSLAQPSKTAINKGNSLHLVLWHGQLRNEEPAKAHVAVSVAGQLLWENVIEIPSGAGVYDITVPVTFDAPAGSVVEYHLHNHGFNTWTLLTVDVAR
jgi:Copper type II ascorbate-dependent monooxygenase, C-terminal domain